MLGNQFRRDPVEIEALAAAHDRGQNFLWLGRRKNKFHMRRRLLQRLQKRVERGCGQHVHFVDDINFVARLRRRVAHVIAKLAHLLDAVVARAIDFQNVKTVASCDLLAIVACSVRRDRRPFFTVKRFS